MNLIERIEKRVELELQRQKKLGKIFISDEAIDNLIDEALREDIDTKNNNGWVKIESEEDLPKIGQYDMSCFELFYYADKRVIKAKYCTGLVLDITHYRLEPLIKPEPPIY